MICLESAIGICDFDECLFEMSYLLVEYIIVGCMRFCMFYESWPAL